jgi:hypothetical protein
MSMLLLPIPLNVLPMPTNLPRNDRTLLLEEDAKATLLSVGMKASRMLNQSDEIFIYNASIFWTPPKNRTE